MAENISYLLIKYFVDCCNLIMHALHSVVMGTEKYMYIYWFIVWWDTIQRSTFLMVYHSSAFQTISRRSVYIKIINYSGSISANSNKTMQRKQHAMKKPHFYSDKNKIYNWLFLWRKEFEQKMFKIFNFC